MSTMNSVPAMDFFLLAQTAPQMVPTSFSEPNLTLGNRSNISNTFRN